MSSIRTRLQVLRAEQDWSQAALAKRAGATSVFINAVEKGRYLPGLGLAFRIARAFDKPIEEVFLYEETEHTRIGSVSWWEILWLIKNSLIGKSQKSDRVRKRYK